MVRQLVLAPALLEVAGELAGLAQVLEAGVVGEHPVGVGRLGPVLVHKGAKKDRRGHTCAMLEGNAIRCWGNGALGRLGYANTERIGDDETPASAGDVMYE